MATPARRLDVSSSDIEDDAASSTSLDPQDQANRTGPSGTTLPTTNSTQSVEAYVRNILRQYPHDDRDRADDQLNEIRIERRSDDPSKYENVSAFRQYNSDEQLDRRRVWPQSRPTTIDEELEDLDASAEELNLDPNPLVEERESAERIYKQKVFLRQLQPPTPQPVEIQVQEVLIPPGPPKPPLHVKVGQREPRTPSPIVIKTAPPQPPPQTDQPIVYNKYVPPPKQPPQQIVIHRYPDLPPKPRPIIIEQWLPYKPPPKRIIKQSLPRDALQTPPPPHNLIISYAKPRALIQVELVRLPVVKVDPMAYQEMSSAGQQQLLQTTASQQEQDLLANLRLDPASAAQLSTQLNWRI